MTAAPQPFFRHVAALCLCLIFSPQLPGASFFWDTDPATAQNQNGSGTWVSGGDAASSLWTASAGSATRTPWTNGNHVANLGATSGYSNDFTGGTITLGENITLNRIDKSSRAGAYVIEAGSGNHTLTLTGTNAGFGNNNADAAAALTINADVIGGSSQIVKFNAGTVILNGTNTWSGGLLISTNQTAGTTSVLQIGNGGTTGTLGSGDVSFITQSVTGVSAQSVLAFNRSDTVTLTQNLVSSPTDTNKGILRQAGSGTLVVASANSAFAGTAQVSAGTLQVGDGATAGSLGGATAVSVSSGATLRFDRTDDTSFSAAVTGAGRLLKAGSGTLTLAGSASTYTGGTVIEAGTLQLANHDALPTGTTVSFTGTGLLDLNGFNQTVSSLTVGNGVTGRVVGTGSTLTATANLTIGGSVANSTATLDLSGLDQFVFSGGVLAVGGTFVTNDGATTLTDGTLILAKNNVINATTINVSALNAGGGNHENRGSLLLGETNVITAANLNIGEVKNQGYVRFADGVTGGTVTLRGTNAAQRMDILIGRHDSNGVVVDESAFDSSAGTLDALVGTLVLGVNNDRVRPALGRFTMGAGLLDATTIVLGRRVSSAASAVGSGASPIGTLELDGGTLLVRSMLFADKLDSVTAGTVTGIFNFKSGTLKAQTLGPGAGTVGVSRILNWTAGTIETYDSSTDLDISGLNIVVSGSGSRVFQPAADRTIEVTSAIINGGTAPVIAFTKRGAGTLELGGSGSTHTGRIDLEEGLLRTVNDEAISNSATLNFAASTTLDLQSYQETISTLQIALGSTATVIGSTGGLTLSNGPNWTIGGIVASTSTVLDMSGLGSFTFNSSTADIQLGSQGNMANNTVTVHLAAQQNLIVARSFGVATVTSGNTGGQNVGTVYLGQNNQIHAGTITVGHLKSLARLEFAAGITDGSLQLRATNGTGRTTVLVGRGESGAVSTNAVFDASGGSLDALIGTLTIGQNNNSGTQGSSTAGAFIFGAGLLDATSIILGDLSNNSTNSTYTGTGTLTLNGPGEIRSPTITLSQRSGTGNGFAHGILNLLGGTLKAATIQRGTSPKGSATLNWEGGTIENLDAGTDLNISGVSIVLNGSGERTFSVTSGRTAMVSASISDGIGSGLSSFTKTGAGTLQLLGANTWEGQTTIQEGVLFAGNSSGSATGGGGVHIQAGGTLAGTGRLAPVGFSDVFNEGTLKPGTPGSATAGTLTLDLTSSQGALLSLGTLSFDLFANEGDNSLSPAANDRLLVLQATSEDIVLQGTLHLGLGAGSSLDSLTDFAEGDRWLLVDWSNIMNAVPTVSFSQISAPELALPPELKWTYEYNQTGLYAVVTIVPEPSRALLLLIGFGGFALRRRRQVR